MKRKKKSDMIRVEVICMFISPMLLDESSVPPEDYANVITELKLDGIRLIYSNLSGIPRLYTKEKKD